MSTSEEITANDRRVRSLVLASAVPFLLVGLVVGLLVGGPIVGVLLGLVLAGAASWAVARAGDGRVAAAVGGRRADVATEARLHNLVDSLCAAAGVPRPTLLVVEDAAPNALAFGIDPKHATLAVTTGLLEGLERVELEGVLAREVARIKHHDTRPATTAVALLSLVGGFGALGRRITAIAAGGGATLADANGVALTRYPPGLIAALEKLLADERVVTAGSRATAHLWLEPPSVGSTTSPHPPLEERIAALREL